MSSAGGLSRRRVAAASSSNEPATQSHSPTTSTPSSTADLLSSNGGGHAGTALEGGHKIAYDPRDMGNEDEVDGVKVPKLTLLEEVLLLGLKDKAVCTLRVCATGRWV